MCSITPGTTSATETLLARPVRPNHSHAAGAALASLADDVLLGTIAAESLAVGVALTRMDRDAVLAASGRNQRTLEVVRR